MSKQPMVRTRIAPSPTGEDLHIGNVYTALINYAFAKKHNGDFIVRIEDTDQKRKVKGSEKKILESLAWLGLNPDESVVRGGPFEPYRQSERLGIYKKYAKQLLANGHAYYCDCSSERLVKVRKQMQKKGLPAKYDRHCINRQKDINKENAVIRMKIPDTGTTEFEDVIRGNIKIENITLDDQIIIKSDGYPTYHLAVVVDDHLMEISHVIRAEEWISSTPKHILLYKFLGWNLPKFAHLPILRNPDRSKLSKRRNPVWIQWYKKEGFLPKAILNYLATLGWSHPDGKDIFDLNEFIECFDLKFIQTTSPIFDNTKLEWMNGEYIRQLPIGTLFTKLIKYLHTYDMHIISTPQKISIVEKTIPLIQTRIKKLSDYLPLCGFFFKPPSEYEKTVHVEWIQNTIEAFSLLRTWDHDALYQKGISISKSLSISKSKLFMDIRIAITGKKIGPPLFESMELLGKKESIRRLKALL